jgi:hypothetical protein
MGQLSMRHQGRFVIVDLVEQKGRAIDGIEADIVAMAAGLAFEAGLRVNEERIRQLALTARFRLEEDDHHMHATISFSGPLFCPRFIRTSINPS